jgi:hypothetical protein
MTNLFKDNWHARVYEQLVDRARTRELKKPSRTDENYVYYEKHHVLPKALGGSNDSSNLVLLTAREHFIAHMLLPRMCIEKSDRIKMNYAIIRMSMKCRLSSKHYENERIRISREGRSAETRAKISATCLGRIHSEEHRAKLSVAKLGKKCRPFSVEHRAKMSTSHIGKKYKPFSAEHRAKISAAKLGKKLGPLSDVHRAKISATILEKKLGQYLIKAKTNVT